jgi:protein phosphatase
MDLQASGRQFGVSFAAITHIGMRRANNQDSLCAAPAATREQWEKQGHLFVVADGMGAHAAGELASQLATNIVVATFRKFSHRPPEEALVAAVEEANRQIHIRAQADDEFRGMGTTICALVLMPSEAILASVGDSRIYRLRNGTFDQLTFDHSLLWELQAAQLIGSEEHQFACVPKNVITRSLGPHPEVKIDIHRVSDVQPGDIFLLCTDGLSGPVADEIIGQVISVFPPEEAARLLVHLANYHGGPDNISAIVVRVEETAGTPSRPKRSFSGWLRLALSFGALTVAILTAILGVVFWRQGQPRSAGVAFSCSCAILMILGSQLWMGAIRRQKAASAAEPEGKLQSGPYRTYPVMVDEKFVSYLAEIANNLYTKGSQEQWPVDWAGFLEVRRAAEERMARGDHLAAAREFGRAICAVMNQLFTKAGAYNHRRARLG